MATPPPAERPPYRSGLDRDERTWVPVPDPTILTTQALDRAVTELQLRIEREVENAKQRLEAQMEALVSVENEKFKTVAQQFDLVERQRVEQKSDTKTAVDAALSAQKEAVREQTIASERAIAKSEQGTTKQLDQISTTFTTALQGMEGQIDDLKDRVTRSESAKAGAVEQRTEQRNNTGLYVAMAGTVIFFLGFVVALVALIYKP